MAPAAGLFVPTTLVEEDEKDVASSHSEPEPLDEAVADMWASVPSHVLQDLPPRSSTSNAATANDTGNSRRSHNDDGDDSDSSSSSSSSSNKNHGSNQDSRNSKNSSRCQAQPAVVEAGGGGEGRRLVPDEDDEDESSSEASSSSSSASDSSPSSASSAAFLRKAMQQQALQRGPSGRRPPAEAERREDEDPLNLGEFFGGGFEAADPLDSDLPSLEETRRRGEELAKKRQAIDKIASKYSASEAGEVLLQRQAGLEDRWRKQQRSNFASQGIQQQLQQQQQQPQPQQLLQEPASRQEPQPQNHEMEQVLLPSPAEDLQFTSLGSLDEGANDSEQGDMIERPADLTSGILGKYQVSEEPHVEDAEVGASKSAGEDLNFPTKLTEVTSSTAIPRPWDPLEGPLMGPRGAPPSREAGLSALQQLGKSFRSLGLQAPRPPQREGSGPTDFDVAKLLDQRFGQDFPPTPASATSKQKMSVKEKSCNSTYEGFVAGDEVRLQNLTRADLNGKIGKVVTASTPVPAGRVPVKVEESSILVKAENLVPASNGPKQQADSEAAAVPATEPTSATSESAEKPDLRAASPSPSSAPAPAPPAQAPCQASLLSPTPPPAFPSPSPPASPSPSPPCPTSSCLQADAQKLSTARAAESQVAKDLWTQCLPGDDLPVGDANFLPSPEAFR